MLKHENIMKIEEERNESNIMRIHSTSINI